MSAPGSTLRLLLALASVYLIWGSTYLAIRFAIESIPPFTMAGTRFLMAGICLFALSKGTGAPNPTAKQWRSAALIGFLMLVCGNGAVCWAEKTVPSGLASLLIATVPLWAVVLTALLPSGSLPRPRVVIGILFGLLGVGILVNPLQSAQSSAIAPSGAAALLFAAAAWAAGSVFSKRVSLPASPTLSTALQTYSNAFSVGAAPGWASYASWACDFAGVDSVEAAGGAALFCAAQAESVRMPMLTSAMSRALIAHRRCRATAG